MLWLETMAQLFEKEGCSTGGPRTRIGVNGRRVIKDAGLGRTTMSEEEEDVCIQISKQNEVWMSTCYVQQQASLYIQVEFNKRVLCSTE